MDSTSIWSRRSNFNKPSLSTSNSENSYNNTEPSTRTTTSSKRWGGDSSSHGRSNPFNNVTPLTTTNISSPTSGASSAFGLGTGAFASFGASVKTPKSPGNALDFGSSTAPPAPPALPSPAGDKREKQGPKDSSHIKSKTSFSSITNNVTSTSEEHPLKHTWVVWYRPQTSKYSDYEKSTIPLASFSTVEAFWTIYSHLKRPSSLPSVSDYHIFKKGVRPVWEDKENRKGGKWIVRLKKGVADRYWEELLLTIVGDQFAEAGEEVCGAVLSVRSGEDVLSVWTRIDGGRNIKIRETIKRSLAFPLDTNIVWKSHDDSIAQRSAIEQARQEKSSGGGNHQNSDKRRSNTIDEGMPDKNRNSAS
ncbi:MAG: hypothetical protein M1836_000715 [Candelina mexicana]|nr:MAG: hypothetical protein M1836_000715 [Candelina mexicana]